MAVWVTEKYSAILSTSKERYQQSKSSKRQEVVKEVAQEIAALAERDGVAVPPSLEKV
jgi:hypothetical protein